MFDTIFFVALFIAIAVLYYLAGLASKALNDVYEDMWEARSAIFDLKFKNFNLEKAIKTLGGRTDDLNKKEQRLVNAYIELKQMLDAVENKIKTTDLSLAMTDELVEILDQENTSLRNFLKLEIDEETFEITKAKPVKKSSRRCC